jgi:hypothetical protein
MDDTITRNALLEPLPWEEELVVKTENKNEPPRRSLAWMQLHMREYFTLRAGRVYKPEPELDKQVQEAKQIFLPVEIETIKA